MKLGNPSLLLLLVGLIPVLVALVALARWRRAAARRLVAGAAVQVSAVRRATKLVLVFAALGLIALAAARPQRGERRILLPREGTDVMLVLDVSVSMLATDVEPNRFERAKVILGGVLDRLQGDRVGLVVFAGTAGMRFPLTTDTAAARELIRTAAIKEGGLAAGTGIGDAIRVAATSFPIDERTRSKVMLIVSDGEDLAGAPADAVRTARDREVTIYTLGIGTEAGGTIVVPRATGTPSQRLDPTSGQPAISRSDTGVLRQIAAAGKGRYFDGTDDDPAAAFAEEVGRLARTRFESQEGSIPLERFQPFVAAALLLLVLDFLLPERLRRTRTARATPGRRTRLGRDRAA